MKFRRARKSNRGRIEIIPMIDVMFFLLATFMLASLSMQRIDGVPLDLPQGRARQMPNDRPVTLSIDRANAVYIDRQRVTLDQVASVVSRLLPPDHGVMMAADAQASHGVVVQAMLAARKGGAEHFFVAVHRE
ncbi:ExbD/TolR family protein [Trinickia diaoshuihuensis]|uniref:ExbD/TolR family protein n=1 Tax=Trinickia diaoshuihuensis TaxID=2292265 RepID=UPI000E233DAF|nr:biopolymer transporter ExbD [Trinickia diaoshuihuensis]